MIEGLGAIPVYCQDIENAGLPSEVTSLASAIAEADAIVVVSPEYNHSLPRFLKNVLDWISRVPSKPFARKPVAIQTASPGALGGARAHEHVRQVLAAMDAVILNRPEVIVTSVAGKVDREAACLKDPASRRQVAAQLAALVEMVRSADGLRAIGHGEPAGNVPTVAFNSS